MFINNIVLVLTSSVMELSFTETAATLTSVTAVINQNIFKQILFKIFSGLNIHFGSVRSAWGDR